MEIKDRLLKIIASEGLNSSAFADSIGVQRSSISHILSGRNKPSIDFLEKILSAYPKYNAEWLIMGTGEIFKVPKQASLFDAEPIQTTTIPLKEIASQLTDPIPPKPMETNHSPSTEINQLYDRPVLKDEPQESYVPLNNHVSTKDRAIDRIVIFYSDHTFTEYKPAK